MCLYEKSPSLYCSISLHFLKETAVCSKHALTSVLWEENKYDSSRMRQISHFLSGGGQAAATPGNLPVPGSTCSLPSGPTWKEGKGGPPFTNERAARHWACLGVGSTFLKEKKQTLDMPLLLDSGKNLIDWCFENFLKLYLCSMRGNILNLCPNQQWART